MATKITLKKSSVEGKVPLATDLEIGELAVNLADGKLYSKNASNTVITVGGQEFIEGTGISITGDTITNTAPHIATNLGSSGTGTTRTITSSTGTNTSITYSAADVGAAPTSHTHNYAGSATAGGSANSANTLARIIRTSSTGGTLSGQFTKVATITLPSRYHDANVDLRLASDSSGSATYFEANVLVRVKQQNAFGENPFIDVIQFNERANTNYQMHYVLVSNEGPTIVDLYIKNNSSWNRVSGFEITANHGGGNIQYFNDTGYLTEVAGAVIAGITRRYHDGYHPEADRLTTPRTINGISFDGSANIAIPQVTTTVDGLMIAGDKSKLNGIADNATDNTGTVTSVSGGDGLSGTVTTTGSLAVDGTVVRTSGDQVIGGVKQLTTEKGFSFGGANYSTYANLFREHENRITWYLDAAKVTSGWGWRSGSNGTGFDWAARLDHNGNFTASGTITGNGSGLTTLNASNLSSGTVATARLPAAALIGDTTYDAMSIAEGEAGTETTSRTVRADYLKEIIEHYVALGGGGGGSSVDVSATAPLSPTEGNLWVDSDSIELFVYYNNIWAQIGGGGGTSPLQESPTGVYTLNGDLIVTGTFTETSDIRAKENIKKIDKALQKVNALSGYTFNMIDSGDTKMGVIAQNLLDVIPEVVRGSDEEGYTVAYGNIVALLIEAIKEQDKRINVLNNTVDMLNHKIGEIR